MYHWALTVLISLDPYQHTLHLAPGTPFKCRLGHSVCQKHIVITPVSSYASSLVFCMDLRPTLLVVYVAFLGFCLQPSLQEVPLAHVTVLPPSSSLAAPGLHGCTLDVVHHLSFSGTSNGPCYQLNTIYVQKFFLSLDDPEDSFYTFLRKKPFRKDEKQDPGNYRLVSLTSSPRKVVEQ